jgi:Xaa-Pro aminopeptidase
VRDACQENRGEPRGRLTEGRRLPTVIHSVRPDPIQRNTVRARPSIPREQYAARRTAARTRAAESGFDGLLIWSMGGSTLDRYQNAFYLTNHYDPGNVFPDTTGLFQGFGMAAVVLPVDGPAILVVNQPDWRDDLVECDEVRVRRNLYDGVAEALVDSGLAGGRIGLTDEERTPVTAFRRLQSLVPDAEFLYADDLLMQMRVVKSPAEIEMMRYASRVSVEIMNAMFGAVAVGRTDGDIAAAGYDVACRRGAQPYDMALASGPEDGHLWWSRMPSWNWQRPYEAGDIVHPDIYGVVDGYYYDFVRSIVVGGQPSDGQLALLEAGIGCIHAGCAAAVVGARGKDVYAAVRAYLVEVGLDHEDSADPGVVSLSTEVLESAGHGIGLGWERPILTPHEDMLLEPGMTIAIEQHVARPGAGTIRYEETVLVTPDGPEIMTAACSARWW